MRDLINDLGGTVMEKENIVDNKNTSYTYILDRISQPSFWVSLGSLITAAGFQIAPDKWQTISGLALGICGFVGMILRSTPATGSVTAETIAPKAITREAIATNAVTNDAIAPMAVNAESIAPNSVTKSALASSTGIK